MAKGANLEFRHHNKVTTYPSSPIVTQTTANTSDTCVLTHPIVKINSAAGSVALALPNGEIGEMITIISAHANDITVTPATSTLIATVILAVVGDQCVLRYVDDTVGWQLISCASVIIDDSPAYTLP